MKFFKSLVLWITFWGITESATSKAIDDVFEEVLDLIKDSLNVKEVIRYDDRSGTIEANTISMYDFRSVNGDKNGANESSGDPLNVMLANIMQSVSKGKLSFKYPSKESSLSLSLWDSRLIPMIPEETFRQLQFIKAQNVTDMTNDRIDTLTLAALINHNVFLNMVKQEAPHWFMSDVGSSRVKRNVLHYLTILNRGSQLLDLVNARDQDNEKLLAILRTAWASIDFQRRSPYEYVTMYCDEVVIESAIQSLVHSFFTIFEDGKMDIERILERDFVGSVKKLLRIKPNLKSVQFGISGGILHFLAKSNGTKARTLITELWKEFPQGLHVRNLRGYRPIDLMENPTSLYPETLDILRFLPDGSSSSFNASLLDSYKTKKSQETGTFEISKQEAIELDLFGSLAPVATQAKLKELRTCTKEKNVSCIEDLLSEYDFLVTEDMRKAMGDLYLDNLLVPTVFAALLSCKSNFHLSRYNLSVTDNDEDPNSRVAHGMVSLTSVASALGAHESLKILIQRHPRVLFYRDEWGRTPLMHAVMLDDLHSIKLMQTSLMQNDIMGFEDSERENAFSIAVALKRQNIVDFFVKEKLYRLWSFSKIGLAPIHYVARNGTLTMIKSFFSRYGRNQSDIVSSNGNTVLHMVLHNLNLNLEMLTQVHRQRPQNAMIYNAAYKKPIDVAKELIDIIPADCIEYLENLDCMGESKKSPAEQLLDWIPSHILKGQQQQQQQQHSTSHKMKKGKKIIKTKPKSVSSKESKLSDTDPLPSDQVKNEIIQDTPKKDVSEDMLIHEISEDEVNQVVSSSKKPKKRKNKSKSKPKAMVGDKEEAAKPECRPSKFVQNLSSESALASAEVSDDDDSGWIKIEKVRKKSPPQVDKKKPIMKKNVKAGELFARLTQVKQELKLEKQQNENSDSLVIQNVIQDVMQDIASEATKGSEEAADKDSDETLEQAPLPPNVPLVSSASIEPFQADTISIIFHECLEDYAEDLVPNRLLTYYEIISPDESGTIDFVKSMHAAALAVPTDRLSCVSQIIAGFVDNIGNSSELVKGVFLSQLQLYNAHPSFTGFNVSRPVALQNLILWCMLVRLNVLTQDDLNACVEFNYQQETAYQMEKFQTISYYLQ